MNVCKNVLFTFYSSTVHVILSPYQLFMKSQIRKNIFLRSYVLPWIRIRRNFLAGTTEPSYVIIRIEYIL